MKKATLSLEFDSPQKAQIIAGSLLPELQKNIPHTTINMNIEENMIILSIQAEQTNTLRAACNSYIRWIQTAVSVQNSL
ncbi:MAG: KEOPS complex subunit Pcc1 [Thermoplasmatota archaeon]